MAITTAQTGKLDESFMPMVNIITAGETFLCTICVNDDVWKTNIVCFLLVSQIDGEEEQRRFEEGKARYLQNKAKRLADKERQQWRLCSTEFPACDSSISTPHNTHAVWRK